MEFIARKVTHPDPKISREEAEKQLKAHPQFKPGTVVVAMVQERGRWVADIHEPKVAVKQAAPFPPGDDAPSGPPTDEPPSDEAPSDEPPKDETEDKPKDKSDNKDDDTGEKITLEGVMDMVKQIAQAVGVHPGGGPGGPDAGMPPADGPHGMPPHPDGPPAPPHDETSGIPGSPDTKQIIHRKAPPGATAIGAPAFASTKTASPKVASFDVEEAVPADFTIRQAKDEIESIWGEHGYRVKKIVEARNDAGERVIRARVSVR